MIDHRAKRSEAEIETKSLCMALSKSFFLLDICEYECHSAYNFSTPFLSEFTYESFILSSTPGCI